MSLISYGTGPAATPPEVIQNNSFWPNIDPADFREVERILDTVSPSRAEYALRVAIADVNRQLSAWQDSQLVLGASTIDDVSAPTWATADHYQVLYRRAVYANAHASLLERYRDVSATGAGDAKGEAKDLAADDYRRDASWAVSEIEGRTHCTVELI